MIDPKAIHVFEQAAATIAEVFPPLLRQFYEGLVAEGFRSDEAMSLTNTMLSSIVFGSKHADEKAE